jgi:hypothetical protein
MPRSATPPVPASAPAMRAVSEVVREMPSALMRNSGRMVWPMSTYRIPTSDGFSRPAIAAMTKTCHGTSALLNASTVTMPASTA